MMAAIGRSEQVSINKPMEGISVVICAYTEERWSQLIAAVASVQEQTLPALDIIVAIDHNQALFERVLREIPGVIAIQNNEMRGLSGARNSGIRCTKGSIIAFMDEDAYADPGWLASLSGEYTDSQVLGVGGSIEPLFPSSRPGWLPQEFDWVIGCTYKGMPESTANVRNLIGCNMSFRRQVFEDVGGFRQGIGRVGTLPVGCEETELCIRALQRWPKGSFCYEPRALVHHRITNNRLTWRYFISRCYYEGRSKAQVSQSVGSRDGLKTERSYVRKTLPQGALKGILEALTLKDGHGLARAMAIVTGLGVTTVGYLSGRIRGVKLLGRIPKQELDIRS